MSIGKFLRRSSVLAIWAAYILLLRLAIVLYFGSPGVPVPYYTGRNLGLGTWHVVMVIEALMVILVTILTSRALRCQIRVSDLGLGVLAAGIAFFLVTYVLWAIENGVVLR